MDRRRFIQRTSTAAAAAAGAVHLTQPAAVGSGKASNGQPADRGDGGDVRRVALIGCGWYGKLDLLQLINIEPVEVVALCDVDSNMLAQAADLVQSRQRSGNRPKTYSDYEALIDAGGIDIVLIETPDHWHALPTISALRAGIDVFVQKPTAIDVLESKAMLDAARQSGRTVQVNTQRRSTPHLVEAKRQIVDAGLLGRVAHAEVCCYYHMRPGGHPPNTDPPAHLDYEKWIGPAPKVPYNDMVHPRSWRAFREFGNGIVGDMCVHMLDLVRWQLGLGWPKRVSSSGGILVQTESRANITDTQTATFEFDDLDVVWTHRSWGQAPDPEFPWAAILYGDKGTLKLSVNKYEFSPRGGGDKMSGSAVIETDQYPTDATDVSKWQLELHVASAIRSHLRDFLDAIDSGGRPIADIEQAHISSAACMLANHSMALGRSLSWDPETHTVLGDDEATAMLKRPYENGYTHPAG